MRKSILMLILTIFILNSINIVISREIKNSNFVSNNNIIYVDDDNIYGPWDGTFEHPYRTINDGVYNATDGDTIYVFNGIYFENITIDKWITLLGESENETIIDGLYHEFVLLLTEDNIAIKNFTIKNSGGYKDNAGIKVNSNKNSISDCIIYRTKTGIYFYNTNHNEIISCTFHTNGEGIFLKSSDFNIVEDCYFSNNALGIHLQNSERNLISNCYAHTNGLGFYFNSSSNNEIIHCAVCDNNDNQGGIALFYCSKIDIINCNIIHNGVGVYVYSSTDILFESCNMLWNTHHAVRARESSQNIIIKNCEIANNFRYGVEIAGGSGKITQNNIYKNHIYGVFSKSSYCDIKYNWWGAITGPAFTSFGIADRVSRVTGRIRYFPWLLRYQSDAGADWKVDDFFTIIELPDDVHKIVEIPGTDTDNDGAPDSWELKWGYDPNEPEDHATLDPDEDGLNNLEECYTDQYGSNPFHKDIFVEFDWTPTQVDGANKPPIDQLELMKAAYEKHNITVHIDDGSLGEGGDIPASSNLPYESLRDVYWDYFLNNDLDNPRKGIFHYGIICDYAPVGGFSVFGWDQLDSYAISSQILVSPFHDRGRLIVTASFHEIGHSLGLFADDFGGIDNVVSANPFFIDFLIYGRYKSSMSYRYAWNIMDFSDGTHGLIDFDDWGNLDFSFFKNTHFDWPQGVN